MTECRAGADDDSLASIAAGFFEAACGDRGWESALADFGKLLAATSGILFVEGVSGAETELLALPGWNRAAVELYSTYYHRLDLYAAVARGRTDEGCFLGHELVEPGEMLRSEIWVDFGAKLLPAFYFVGMTMPLENGRGGRMAWHRERSARSFNETDRSLMLQVLPHLRRSLQLRDRLRGAIGLHARVVEQLALPILILDGDGSVLGCNPSAEQACRSGPLLLQRDGSRGCTVRASRSDDDRRFRHVIRQTADGGPGGGLLLADREASTRYAVLVCRIPSSATRIGGVPGCGGSVLVTIRDLSRPALPEPCRLGEIFGLTGTEAVIASRLAGGETVAAITLERRTSPLTVRAQIRAILVKTGANSLRDLIRLAADTTDPVHLAANPGCRSCT